MTHAYADTSLIGLLRSRDQSNGVDHSGAHASNNVNIDGSLRDEDLFVVGDDEDDEDEDERGAGKSGRSYTPPPPYPESTLAVNHDLPQVSCSTATASRSTVGYNESKSNDGLEQHVIAQPAVDTIYVRKTDTLVGLALKYGMDVRAHLLMHLVLLPFLCLPYRLTPHRISDVFLGFSVLCR